MVIFLRFISCYNNFSFRKGAAMKGIKDFFLFFIDQSIPIRSSTLQPHGIQCLLAFIPFAMIIHSFFSGCHRTGACISEKIQELLPPSWMPCWNRPISYPTALRPLFGPPAFCTLCAYFLHRRPASLVITVTKVMQVKETAQLFQALGRGNHLSGFFIIFMFFFFAFY